MVAKIGKNFRKEAISRNSAVRNPERRDITNITERTKNKRISELARSIANIAAGEPIAKYNKTAVDLS